MDTVSGTKPWFVYCIKPNDEWLANKLDQRKIKVIQVNCFINSKVQLQAFKLPELAQSRRNNDFSFSLGFEEFYQRYQKIIDPLDISETNMMKLCSEFMTLSEWNEHEMAISRSKA